MKKDRKYIAYLSIAIVIFLVIRMAGPREFNWTVTFHPEDKNPFGGYVLNEMMTDVFDADKLQRSHLTLYELVDSIKTPFNIISISTGFLAGDEDARALLKNTEEGGNAFIAAQHFSNNLLDTLSLSTSDYFFDQTFEAMFSKNDTSKVIFKNSSLKGETTFTYPRKNIHNYFDDFDSTRTTIVAVNDLDLPVLIRMAWGKGNLYLCSTPLAFTNVYLLQNNNHEFAEKALSYLPEENVQWTAFYHLGRMEISSPLRFVLTTEPLMWAYYISLAAVLIFMVFEAKRRQRIIPVIKPLQNTSLEFVSTVGNLYYQNADHKNIAEKKIVFFLEQIRSKYLLNTNTIDEEFIKTLSRKSGQAEEDVGKLFELITRIHNQEKITADELLNLNLKIEKFTF